MKRIAAAFVLALAAAACGAPQQLHAVADTRDPVDVDRPHEKTGTSALPPDLTCVSAGAPANPGSVVRSQLMTSADHVDATVSDGPLFAVHDTVPDTTPAPAPFTTQRLVPGDAPVERDGVAAVRLVGVDDGALAFDLRKDGMVWRGRGLGGDVTCWNNDEVFGSPWAQGIGGSLSARFDWSTGRCTDRDGKPALNPIPIEIVRETGFGECADLSGVALNGDDFGMPLLSGFDLAGANLDGARLFFADLKNATLNGANLTNLQFGYATIEGTVDDNTALPALMSACSVTQSPWSGDELSCSN